jgi:hypothetical protein
MFGHLEGLPRPSRSTALTLLYHAVLDLDKGSMPWPGRLPAGDRTFASHAFCPLFGSTATSLKSSGTRIDIPTTP